MLPERLTGDLDGLVAALRQQPGETGAIGLVNVADEFFVAIRVRGHRGPAAALRRHGGRGLGPRRQVVSSLGIPVPGDDDIEDVWPAGDLTIFADLGMDEMELGAVLADLEAYADEMLSAVAARLGFADVYERALEAQCAEEQCQRRRETRRALLRSGAWPAAASGWAGQEVELDEVEDLDGVDRAGARHGRRRRGHRAAARSRRTTSTGRRPGRRRRRRPAELRLRRAGGRDQRARGQVLATSSTASRWSTTTTRTTTSRAARPTASPAATTPLLADLGTPSQRLLALCAEEGKLPADVIDARVRGAGCPEVLEELRGA